MSAAPNQTVPPKREEEARPAAGRPLVDLGGIDLTQRIAGREEIAKLNPHRGDMAMLDWIVWSSPDNRQGVALKRVGNQEFWVPGHFPARPMFPGVLMIEAGAQLACYLYNSRIPGHPIVAFTRIEDASFRSMVQPGDDLYLLCAEVKFGRRRFVSDIQGVVGAAGRIAFDARISGMTLQ
jgi:3-hydroxyacyl-[acyl-carrier-protein] dehydratase